jgi:hypothetical protein
MANLPRVDEALQTGIWYPYHKGLENRSWHPVYREFAQTHDAFAPSRYAISAAWLASQSQKSNGTTPASPLSGVPGIRALTQAISRGGLKNKISQVMSYAHLEPPKAVAKVALTRAAKKTAQRRPRPTVIRHAALPGNLVSSGAINKVKRSLPGLQRPLPDNVKMRPGTQIRSASAAWRGRVASAAANSTLKGCGYSNGCGY